MTVKKLQAGRPTTSPIHQEERNRRSQRPTTAPPTEYTHAFQDRHVPKPRNPVSNWQSRHLSNILPSETGSPRHAIQPRRTPHRPWPWMRRSTGSQVFPGTNNTPRRTTPSDGPKDVNNNPSKPPPNPQIRRQWPWQARAQRSAIYFDDVPRQARQGEESPSNPQQPPAATSKVEPRAKWPWQERALKSMIFEDNPDSEKAAKKKPRVYQWDQRQSTLVSAAVKQVDVEESKKEDKSKRTEWPWEERAKQSLVFSSPDKFKPNREVKFVWDQRKTRLSVNPDPEETSPQVSLYNESFSTKKGLRDSSSMPPAGKPCYQDDDVFDNKENKRQRRRGECIENQGETAPKPIPLHYHQVDHQSQDKKKSTGNKVRFAENLEPVLSKHEGEGKDSCKIDTPSKELVPFGYRFSNNNNSSRSERKVNSL